MNLVTISPPHPAQISITDGWIGRTYTGCDVIRNPSRIELGNLIRLDTRGEVRAFLSQNLYVWSSKVLHHDFPMELLAPEDASCALRKGEDGRACVNLHITVNGPYIAAANIAFEDDDETPTAQFDVDKAFVEQHPIMRRLFGRFELRIED